MEPDAGVRFGHVDGIVLNENLAPATDAGVRVRIDRDAPIEFALSIGAELQGRQVLAASIEPDGTPQVRFGDGRQGRRPAEGDPALRTTYGYGAGVRGNVGSGAITTIVSRPMTPETVTNPAPTSGGAEPEEIDEAVTSIPSEVRSRDRAVSLADFTDITRSLADVARVEGTSTWSTRESCAFAFMALVTGSPGSKIDHAKVTAIGIAANPPVADDQVLTFDVTVFVGLLSGAVAGATRLCSEEGSTPLRDLLSVVADELQRLADDIEELWDDAFVGDETTWAVPYIGVLVGRCASQG